MTIVCLRKASVQFFQGRKVIHFKQTKIELSPRRSRGHRDEIAGTF